MVEVTEDAAEEMRARRRKQALIADNLVVAQQNEADSMFIIKLIALARVGSAKVLPALLFDEYVVAQRKARSSRSRC